MNQLNERVNELVKTVQAEGFESMAFVDLFEIINKRIIEPKAFSFEKQIYGDVNEAISKGYQLLMASIGSWKDTGSFTAYYEKSFDRIMKNMVRDSNRLKRKPTHNYDLSLSADIESETGKTPIIELIKDTKVNSSFDITNIELDAEALLHTFREKSSEKADIIEILISFPNETKQHEKTEALCNYYNIEVSDYPKIQKKVSRAKEAFVKFIEAAKHAAI